MFYSFFCSFSPSGSWEHLTVLNKPGQPHRRLSPNHLKREQSPFLVQLGTVSLCLSCQGYFGPQLSLARACYGFLFSETHCLDWLPSLNWALSYHHRPTWTSLDLTYELASWFCLPGLILELLCQHAFVSWSGLLVAIYEPILLGLLEATGQAVGSPQFLACHPLEKWPGFAALSSAFFKCVCVCVSAQRWGTVLSRWQKVVAPTHSTEML